MEKNESKKINNLFLRIMKHMSNIKKQKTPSLTTERCFASPGIFRCAVDRVICQKSNSEVCNTVSNYITIKHKYANYLNKKTHHQIGD